MGIVIVVPSHFNRIESHRNRNCRDSLSQKETQNSNSNSNSNELMQDCKCSGVLSFVHLNKFIPAPDPSSTFALSKTTSVAIV